MKSSPFSLIDTIITSGANLGEVSQTSITLSIISDGDNSQENTAANEQNQVALSLIALFSFTILIL